MELPEDEAPAEESTSSTESTSSGAATAEEAEEAAETSAAAEAEETAEVGGTAGAERVGLAKADLAEPEAAEADEDEPAEDEPADDEPAEDEPAAEADGDEPEAEADEDLVEEDEDEEEEEDAERVAAAAELWSDVRIAPVEIALPKGVGYTLRAYRKTSELAPVEVAERDDEFAEFLAGHADDDEAIDEEELAELAAAGARLRERSEREARTRTKRAEYDEDADEDDELEDDEIDEDEDEDDEYDEDADEEDEEEEDDDEDPDALADEDEEDEDEGEDDEDEDDEKAAADEEVPVFLGHHGRLYLFESAEALVEFVQASEEHDLAQLDTWSELRERLSAEDVLPDPADRYELDLVVDNLRGGSDSVDTDLLIQAGEIARDVGYALRLEPVITALAAGSPLDDLDDAARAVGGGGLRAFLARRKLRKMVTQQTALGWRTIIGKISGAVDWRE